MGSNATSHAIQTQRVCRVESGSLTIMQLAKSVASEISSIKESLGGALVVFSFSIQAFIKRFVTESSQFCE